MTNISISSLERARRDILELHRALSDLSQWLDAQPTELPYVEELRRRVTRIGEFLQRLTLGLDQQEKERAQLVGLFQVGRAVNSTLELDEVLNRAMDIIIQVTRAERGFLMLANPDGELSFQVARNMEQSTIDSPAFQVSRSIIERVAQTGQPIVTTDAQQDPRFSDQDSVVSLSLRSILCTPLKARDRVVGVVYVDNRLHAGMFQQADVEAFRAFADQAAIAIENAQLFANVQQKMYEIAGLKTMQDNIFASIASGVLATDLQDHITSFNRAAEAIFGKSAEESMGQPYQAALAPLSKTNLPSLIEEVKRDGSPHVATEIDSELPDRGLVNLIFSISSLKDAGGNPQGITIVVDDLTEKRQLEATREMFRRYVAPAVVDRLPGNPAQLRLGGQRQQITIMFADIRGFTHFSEPLAPEELVDVLNQYLAVAGEAILQQEGTLDKFMGDAVMAIFNAPLPQDDHPLRAVRAALAMRAAVVRLHEQLPPSLRLHYGIGIHTGDAVVGNVGTEQQMNYTAIGDAVNLAKRLQENATAGEIILSGDAYARVCNHVTVKRLAPIQVKGRQALTEIWELVGMFDTPQILEMGK